MRSQLLASGLLAILLTAAGAATAQEFDPDLVARATEEGEVTWYTGLLADEAAAPMVEAFKETFPDIEAHFVRMTGSQMAPRLEEEATAGTVTADVFDGSNTVASIAPLGLIEPWVPDGAKNIPADFRDSEGLWTAQVMYYLAVGYNTDAVTEEDVPQNYEDLLDSRWQGRIGWSSSGTASGRGFVGNVLDTMAEEAGMDYLRRLAEQDIVFIKGGGAQALQAVADGETDIGLSIFTHHTLIQAERGGHVGFVVFEPALAFVNPIGLVRDAPHPNAGRLLIEFVLSDRGQKILRDSNHIPSSVNVAVADPAVNTGFAVNFLSPARAAETRAGWDAVVDELFRN